MIRDHEKDAIARMSASTREQRGWYLYDWANSAFSVTVVTLFLGPYLTSLAKASAGADGRIHLLGMPIDPRSYWSYLVGFSVALQVLFLPVIGAIVDYGRRKKEALAATAYLGAAAAAAMYFVSEGKYLLGGALFLCCGERELRRGRGNLQFLSA